MASHDFDVLIVGSGLAGLSAALHLAPTHRVAVITKRTLQDGSSGWAQGGIAAVLADDDSFAAHIEDTLVAGAGLCDLATTRFVVENAPESIAWLRGLGVPFTLEGDQLHLTREGGHSARRIAHVTDATGAAVQRTLIDVVRSTPGITLFEQHTLVDLITTRKLGLPGNRCLGLYALDSDTDAALAAASDSKVATQKATKSYVDARFPIHRSATTSRRISTKGSFNPGAAEGMTTTGDRVYAPIFLPAGTYNTLSVRSTTAGTSTWRLGIFNGASGDPTRPGTVLKDAGTINLSATAAMLTLSSLNFTIPADGWYWCCAQVETYTSAPQLVCAHADSKTDLLFPGWPGQEGNYLRAYCGYQDLSPSAGALTTANAITGNASTGLDYAGNVPRFWVGP